MGLKERVTWSGGETGELEREGGREGGWVGGWIDWCGGFLQATRIIEEQLGGGGGKVGGRVAKEVGEGCAKGGWVGGCCCRWGGVGWGGCCWWVVGLLWVWWEVGWGGGGAEMG